MPPDTEVISCPACKHLLRVPPDFLGQTVQCPECTAMFTAPIREGDRLTEAVLLSQPAAKSRSPENTKRADPLLILPAFGLMLLGFASLIVNVWTGVRYQREPAAAEQDVVGILQSVRGEKPLEGGKSPEEEAAELAPKIRVLVPVFAVVGGLVCYGGIAIVRRRHYRMAQLGCVLASVNLANGCCFPGAIFGLWGLLMLMSEEGQNHFQTG